MHTFIQNTSVCVSLCARGACLCSVIDPQLSRTKEADDQNSESWRPCSSLCRRHPVKRERDGTDGGDAKRGRGQPEEHLLPRGAQGPGDVPSGGRSPGVHASALPHSLAHGQHQEPAAQRRLLPAVGVVAAAPPVSYRRALFHHLRPSVRLPPAAAFQTHLAIFNIYNFFKESQKQSLECVN